MKRKLPSPGDRIAYTRNALSTFSGRANWRGVLTSMCDFATPDWPMGNIRWDNGAEMEINIHQLCTTKSVAFIE
jgi:hypothetical protein